jgi:phosphoribosylglycinamide formyltransferase
MKKIAVLISGNGSNLQALIDATINKTLLAEISVVVSNSSKAYGLQRASDHHIKTVVQTLKSFKDQGKTRLDYDLELVKVIKSHFVEESGPDLIVLAGFMHILSKEFIDAFPQRIINLHPALPGAFDGAHAIDRAFEAFQKGEISETGIMVHYVIPEVDRGQVILVQKIPILEKDTLEALETRIHQEEHKLIVGAVKKVLDC